MSTQALYIRCLLALAVLAQPFAVTTNGAEPILGRAFRLVEEAKYEGTEPRTGYDGSVELLAQNIDWLEHHIDTYGSVVAKHPDIWGEARLTKHRDEYEKILYQELTQFQIRINANITQTDSAFLAQAIALSQAADGGSARPARNSGDTNVVVEGATIEEQEQQVMSLENVVLPELKKAPDITAPLGSIKGTTAVGLEPVVHLNQLSRYMNHLQELRRINEGDDTSDAPGYALNLVRIPVSIMPGKLTRTGFGAEVTVTATPVLSEDLLPNTFRNLVVNDVVDQLGLPIVQISDQWERITKRDELEAELENLKQAKVWLAKLASQLTLLPPKEAARFLLAYVKSGIHHKNSLISQFAKDLDAIERDVEGRERTGLVVSDKSDKLLSLYSAEGKVLSDSLVPTKNAWQQLQAGEVNVEELQGIINKGQVAADEELSKVNRRIEELLAKVGSEEDVAATQLALLTRYSGLPIPSGRSRNARTPLPPTQIGSVFGVDQLKKLTETFKYSYFGRNVRWAGYAESVVDKKPVESRVDLLDVQKWLQAETAAAYELLSTPQHLGVFYKYAGPEKRLAEAIRSDHLTSNGHDAEHSVVDQLRCEFFRDLHLNHEMPLKRGETIVSEETDTCPSEIEILAWAVVVEAALLNEQLNEDLRRVGRAKGCYELVTEQDYAFFLPDSVMRNTQQTDPMLQEEFHQATQIFQQYVKCRWPIHVFAVDPVTQDQNVGDASARRRELQFAMSLGFVQGRIGARSLTQFSRELETQIATIALNSTAAGFSHGHDTFGWRFYPRVQALHVPNTIGAIKQTLCGVSRDDDLNHRQIEPGIRECTAIVLMPSFVPYADFDVHTNWFKLTNPKNAALTTKDTVHLSRAITAMRNSRAICAECAHLYRPGEVDRLLKRVEQLDRELPLQTMRAQIPYENTFGGFEMFNTGVTDLAPELIGWYGAPGIVVSDNASSDYKCCCNASQGSVDVLSTQIAEVKDLPQKAKPLPICQGEGTTVFLVGDHFSVHDTKVIAGGVCMPNVQLVSRQIMRVTIPSCVSKVNVGGQDYVAVYAATPYGITNHLHIPVHSRSLEKPTTDAITAAVKSEVAKQFAQVELPPAPDVRISPVANSPKLTIEAMCDEANLTQLKLKITSAPTLQYAVAHPSAPGTLPLQASIIRKGGFLTPLFNVDSIGGASGNVTADRLREVVESQFASLGEKIPYTALTDDGKDEIAVVFYLDHDNNPATLPIRLSQDIPCEVVLAHRCHETISPVTKVEVDCGCDKVPQAAAPPQQTSGIPPAAGGTGPTPAESLPTPTIGSP